MRVRNGERAAAGRCATLESIARVGDTRAAERPAVAAGPDACRGAGDDEGPSDIDPGRRLRRRARRAGPGGGRLCQRHPDRPEGLLRGHVLDAQDAGGAGHGPPGAHEVRRFPERRVPAGRGRGTGRGQRETGGRNRDSIRHRHRRHGLVLHVLSGRQIAGRADGGGARGGNGRRTRTTTRRQERPDRRRRAGRSRAGRRNCRPLSQQDRHRDRRTRPPSRRPEAQGEPDRRKAAQGPRPSRSRPARGSLRTIPPTGMPTSSTRAWAWFRTPPS